MEKRLILAATLSFFVLYFWTLMNPPQKVKTASQHTSEHLSNISLPSVTEDKKDTLSQDARSLPRPRRVIKSIETDKLIAKFSNIGGCLQEVLIKGYDVTLPITDINDMLPYNKVAFLLKQIQDNIILYEYEDKEILIQKKYIIDKKKYTINSNINIKYKQKAHNKNKFSITALSLKMSKLKASDLKARNKSFQEYVVYSDKGMLRKNNAYKFSLKENKDIAAKVFWVGFRNQYYCAIVKPLYKTAGYAIKVQDNKDAALMIRPVWEQGAVEQNFSSLIYIGPESLDLLNKVDTSFSKIKRYYRFGLLDLMGKIVNRIIHLLHKVIPNWGVCIILMSILISIITYPITIKNMISMKKMQALQPQMTALKEKYKNNPQKFNIEVMELYKRNNVNPMAGCLPMFLQMPIFFGLIQALWRDVAFKGAGFLWIKDLTEPDRLFLLPFKLPYIGNEINILPILMMILMFLQQKLSSSNTTGMDPEQEAQQKMMRIFLPLMYGAIFYKFASGLALYWTTFNVLSCFTQWKIAKMNNAAGKAG